MPTYRECSEAANRLRDQARGMLELADFIESRGVKMPSIPYVSSDRTFNVWLTESRSSFDRETNKWESRLDEFGTTANILGFVKVLGSCKKEYVDAALKITKRFGAVILEGSADRKIVCKKKVVDRKWIEPSTHEGYYQETVEWECTTPSLLGLVNQSK